MIEFAAVDVRFNDDDYDGAYIPAVIVNKLQFLINPGVPMEPKFSKITGITDALLSAAPKFVTAFPQIQDFFLGQRRMVAHNLSFDRGVLAEELKRIDRLLNFPWPIEHFCTVELTQDLHLKDRKLTTLYEHYFAEPIKQTHRAMDDVMTLVKIVEAMHNEGRL